jgi:hypothetical protein
MREQHERFRPEKWSQKQMSVSTWINVVLAVTAVISACVVWEGIKEQNVNFEKQSAAYQLALSADTALKFDARFNEPGFKRLRSIAAKALLTHTSEEEAEDVFDFFDTVGLFVRLGALSGEVAHSLFFHRINLYWKAGSNTSVQSRWKLPRCGRSLRACTTACARLRVSTTETQRI